MTIIDRLLGREPELKTNVLTIYDAGIQRLPARPSTAPGVLIDIYRGNPIVRACVVIKSRAATDPRLVVQERNKAGEWEEAAGHPLRRLIMRPNPRMDEAMFMAYAQKSIEVMGIFYAEIVRSRAGAPVELYPLQPNKVFPKFRKRSDGRRELTHYEWKDGMYSKDIPVEDMLVRDDAELGGTLSPLAAVMRNVDSDNAHTDYVRGFFNNAGVPSGIIKVKGRKLTQEQSDAIRAQWRAKYGRQWGNQHDVAVIDEDAEYQKTGANLDELSSSDLRNLDESRITMGFGVSPIIIYAYVGLMRSIDSNVEGAWKNFWQTTMSAELKAWRSFLTIHLLSEFVEDDAVLAENIRLYWDKSEVGALQENLDKVHERERYAFRAGGTTLNEFRSAIGRDEFDDREIGEMNYFQMQAAIMGNLSDSIDPNDSDPDADKVTRPFPQQAKAKQVIIERKQEAEREQEQDQLDSYGEDVYELADKARNGEIEKSEFTSRLQELAEESLVAFFLLGMLFGDDGTLSDDEWAALEEHVIKARESAESLSDDIFDGRYGGVYRDEDEDGEPASLAERAALWVGAAATVITLGRVFRRDDPILEWRFGPTDHCDDCLSSHGTRMAASSWRINWPKDMLPRGRGLECGGYKCLCDLYEVIDEEND